MSGYREYQHCLRCLSTLLVVILQNKNIISWPVRSIQCYLTSYLVQFRDCFSCKRPFGVSCYHQAGNQVALIHSMPIQKIFFGLAIYLGRVGSYLYQSIDAQEDAVTRITFLWTWYRGFLVIVENYNEIWAKINFGPCPKIAIQCKNSTFESVLCKLKQFESRPGSQRWSLF